MKDMNGKECNENAPFLELQNGLDPNAHYTQEFKYASYNTHANKAPSGVKTPPHWPVQPESTTKPL